MPYGDAVNDPVIIYPNGSGGVALVVPNLACGIPVLQIGRKDTPAGTPFLIVERSSLPAELGTYMPDFSAPSGVGIGAEAWFAEQQPTN